MLADSSSAMQNVSETVSQVKDSLLTAAEMIGDTSETMLNISKKIEFEILGYVPLGGVSNYFLSVSEDFDALSDDLKNMSDSVGNNIEDIDNISNDLKNISTKLENFSSSFSSTTQSMPEVKLKTVLYFIFVYFIVINVIFILIGLCLLTLAKSIVS